MSSLAQSFFLDQHKSLKIFFNLSLIVSASLSFSLTCLSSLSKKVYNSMFPASHASLVLLEILSNEMYISIFSIFPPMCPGSPGWQPLSVAPIMSAHHHPSTLPVHFYKYISYTHTQLNTIRAFIHFFIIFYLIRLRRSVMRGTWVHTAATSICNATPFWPRASSKR